MDRSYGDGHLTNATGTNHVGIILLQCQYRPLHDVHLLLDRGTFSSVVRRLDHVYGTIVDPTDGPTPALRSVGNVRSWYDDPQQQQPRPPPPKQSDEYIRRARRTDTFPLCRGAYDDLCRLEFPPRTLYTGCGLGEGTLITP